VDVRVLAFLLILACAAPGWAAKWVLHVERALSAADRAGLERSVARAVLEFERHVGPLARPVVVRVGASSLQAGYSVERDEVGFPSNGDVIEGGVRSADVVHHEMFHAMACQYAPARAAAQGDEDQRALHEGLADFFAHALEPDEHFGEGFYAGRPHMRAYREGLCYALARGSHARGGALCGHLIDSGFTLKDVGVFLRGEAFTREALLARGGEVPACFAGAGAPAVDVSARGYPDSMLQKYVLAAGKPLELVFRGDAAFARAYGALDVTWGEALAASGVMAERVAGERDGEVVWRLSAPVGIKPVKLIALYRANARVIGFLPIYLRVAK
jgi:hypothetical protein